MTHPPGPTNPKKFRKKGVLLAVKESIDAENKKEEYCETHISEGGNNAINSVLASGDALMKEVCFIDWFIHVLLIG